MNKVVQLLVILLFSSVFAISQSVPQAPALTRPSDATPTTVYHYEGYMADILCVKRRNGLDGADMLLKPQDHTVHCLVDIAACYNSGFCLLQRLGNGQEGWGCAHTFTTSETLAIRTKLLNPRNDAAGLYLRFGATWSDDGVLTPDVSSMVATTPSQPTTPSPTQPTTTTAAPPTAVSATTSTPTTIQLQTPNPTTMAAPPTSTLVPTSAPATTAVISPTPQPTSSPSTPQSTSVAPSQSTPTPTTSSSAPLTPQQEVTTSAPSFSENATVFEITVDADSYTSDESFMSALSSALNGRVVVMNISQGSELTIRVTVHSASQAAAFRSSASAGTLPLTISSWREVVTMGSSTTTTVPTSPEEEDSSLGVVWIVILSVVGVAVIIVFVVIIVIVAMRKSEGTSEQRQGSSSTAYRQNTTTKDTAGPSPPILASVPQQAQQHQQPIDNQCVIVSPAPNRPPPKWGKDDEDL